MKIKTLKGLALQDILTEVHLYVHRGQSINIWLWFVFISRIIFFASENMKCSKCILYVAFPNTHTFRAASSVQKSPVRWPCGIGFSSLTTMDSILHLPDG